MQIAQSGTLENVELQGRLNVGGRWYGKAQVVAIDSADAEVLKSRGVAVKAKPGAKPANVEEIKEVVKPQQVPVQTKEPEQTPETVTWEDPTKSVTKDTSNGQRPNKKR